MSCLACQIGSTLHLLHRTVTPPHQAKKPYLEEQHLVLLLHRRQKRILGEIILAGRVLLICPLDLLFQRLDIRGKQSGQTKVLSFLFGERRSLVEVGVVEQDGAPERAFQGAARAQREMPKRRLPLRVLTAHFGRISSPTNKRCS